MEELGAAAETEEPVQEEEIQGRTSRGREPSWGSAEREANAPEAWQQGVVGDRDQSDGDRGLTGGLSGGRGGEPQAGRGPQSPEVGILGKGLFVLRLCMTVCPWACSRARWMCVSVSLYPCEGSVCQPGIVLQVCVSGRLYPVCAAGCNFPQEMLQAWGPRDIAQGSTKLLDLVPTYPSPARREQCERTSQQVQMGVRVTMLYATPFILLFLQASSVLEG